MRHLLHYSWLLPLMLFMAHQLLQKVLHYPIYVLDAYLDPFCLGALGLFLLTLQYKWLTGSAALPFAHALVAVLWFIGVAEILFPYLSSGFVADWLDALFITMGAAWFWFAWPKQKVLLQNNR